MNSYNKNNKKTNRNNNDTLQNTLHSPLSSSLSSLSTSNIHQSNKVPTKTTIKTKMPAKGTKTLASINLPEVITFEELLKTSKMSLKKRAMLVSDSSTCNGEQIIDETSSHNNNAHALQKQNQLQETKKTQQQNEKQKESERKRSQQEEQKLVLTRPLNNITASNSNIHKIAPLNRNNRSNSNAKKNNKNNRKKIKQQKGEQGLSMYERSQLHLIAKDQKLQMLREQVYQDCTFHPNVPATRFSSPSSLQQQQQRKEQHQRPIQHHQNQKRQQKHQKQRGKSTRSSNGSNNKENSDTTESSLLGLSRNNTGASSRQKVVATTHQYSRYDHPPINRTPSGTTTASSTRSRGTTQMSTPTTKSNYPTANVSAAVMAYHNNAIYQQHYHPRHHPDAVSLMSNSSTCTSTSTSKHAYATSSCSNSSLAATIGNNTASPRIEELYQNGLRKARRRPANLQEETAVRTRRLEAKELEECTFKPQLYWGAKLYLTRNRNHRRRIKNKNGTTGNYSKYDKLDNETLKSSKHDNDACNDSQVKEDMAHIQQIQQQEQSHIFEEKGNNDSDNSSDDKSGSTYDNSATLYLQQQLEELEQLQQFKRRQHQQQQEPLPLEIATPTTTKTKPTSSGNAGTGTTPPLSEYLTKGSFPTVTDYYPKRVVAAKKKSSISSNKTVAVVAPTTVTNVSTTAVVGINADRHNGSTPTIASTSAHQTSLFSTVVLDSHSRKKNNDKTQKSKDGNNKSSNSCKQGNMNCEQQLKENTDDDPWYNFESDDVSLGTVTPLRPHALGQVQSQELPQANTYNGNTKIHRDMISSSSSSSSFLSSVSGDSEEGRFPRRPRIIFCGTTVAENTTTIFSRDGTDYGSI